MILAQWRYACALLPSALSNSSKKAPLAVTVLGQQFPSLQAAADHYGKPAKLFRKRMLISGLTPEQALELEPFPEWFKPGKGQLAKAKGEARRAAEAQTGLRRCGTCKEYLPLGEFNRQRGDLLSYRCKTCTSGALVQARYGLQPERFLALADRQEWRCAICRTSLKAKKGSTYRDRTCAVDHCHSSGAVRGLLCNKCNVGLGSFNDSPEIMRAAIGYLCRPTAQWPVLL